jgi:putative transferase (TIGR04331 family)
MNTNMRRSFFLSTTELDNANPNNKNNFFLGSFCHATNCKENFLKKKNTLGSDSENKKNLFLLKESKKKKILYLKVLKILSTQLNIIHKTNHSVNYWEMIVSSWLHFYINIIYNRWNDITNFKKKYPNQKFYTYKYKKKNNDSYSDLHQWLKSMVTDEFNHYLFIKLFEFRKITNVQIYKKKIKFKRKKSKESKQHNVKYFFFKFCNNFLSSLALRLNTVVFDTFITTKSFFFQLCLKNLIIPIKIISLFQNKYRKFIKKDNYKKKLLEKNLIKIKKFDHFGTFLIKNISEYIPMSYVENYSQIKERQKSFIKKRLIVSMYEFSFNDYFRNFLAESKLLNSKIIFVEHGGGIHPETDSLRSIHKRIADKFIVSGLGAKIKKNDKYLSPVIKFNYGQRISRLKIRENKKILIAYNESSKYKFRGLFGSKGLDEDLKLFFELTNSLKNLKSNIMNGIKFRPKTNEHNTSKKFQVLFGKNFLEKSTNVSFSESINMSKIVINFIPQTSFTECLQYNIPSILIKNSSVHINNKITKKIFNNFYASKILFKNSKEAINFINENWNNIDKWWFSKKVQASRKLFLKNYFYHRNNYVNEWSDFIKQETNSLNLN